MMLKSGDLAKASFHYPGTGQVPDLNGFVLQVAQDARGYFFLALLSLINSSRIAICNRREP